MKLQNTLKLDISLLAKNHYRVHNNSRVEAVRRICMVHMLMGPGSFGLAATLRRLLEEFSTGCTPPIIRPSEMIDILYAEVTDQNDILRVALGDEDQGATYRSIESILNAICRVQVLDGKTAQQAGMIGQVDPLIVELLTDIAK